MTNSEKLAVAYHRVSPTNRKKGESGIHTSLEESIRITHKDAEYEGFKIIHDYVDEYISGKSTKLLPDLNTMMNDARTNKHGDTCRRIYVRRVNRLGRDRAGVIQNEIELSSIGWTIKSVELGIDTGKPMGKSLMGLFAEFAEDERLENMENITRGREAAILKGVKFGKPPKKVNVDLVRRERLAGTKWKQLEADLDVSTPVMIQRLKDAGHWDYTRSTVK